MFVRIDNDPREYAWGSPHAIAQLLGREASGNPEAELWLGAHPTSPSRVLEPEHTGGALSLASWEESAELPFLLKVLAANAPLSLQAHPSLAQAKAGFARENAAGIPLDSPERNYADPNHKPELIYALSDHFDALCGFRSPSESARALRTLGGGETTIETFARSLDGDPRTVVRDATSWLLSGEDGVEELVTAIVGAATDYQDGEAALEADTVRLLNQGFPGDPGIVLSLLLNRTRLSRGEVLYLPAGNIHAYLRGLGIELMASSDNVMRGGLSKKRIDRAELLAILDFSPMDPTPLTPTVLGPGLTEFRPSVPDFVLLHLARQCDAESIITVPRMALALCTEGTLELRGTQTSRTLQRGEALYITADEQTITVSGVGEMFLAQPGG